MHFGLTSEAAARLRARLADSVRRTQQTPPLVPVETADKEEPIIGKVTWWTTIWQPPRGRGPTMPGLLSCRQLSSSRSKAHRSLKYLHGSARLQRWQQTRLPVLILVAQTPGNPLHTAPTGRKHLRHDTSLDLDKLWSQAGSLHAYNGCDSLTVGASYWLHTVRSEPDSSPTPCTHLHSSVAIW